VLWFLSLPFEHPSDFWLNVLAGLPFLVFDVIIITLLLPRTIEWWQERSWQRTRLTAISHVLKSYSDLLLLKDFPRVSEVVGAGGKVEATSAIRAHLRQFVDRLQQGNRDLENELQAALPILGPHLTEELLTFHYAWKTYLHGSRALADMLIQYADSPEEYGSGNIPEASVYAHYMTAASMGILFRRLKIRFARIQSAAEAAAETPHMLADLPDLFFRNWWAALSAKEPNAADLSIQWRAYAEEQLEANKTLLRGNERVGIYRYRDTLSRLARRSEVPLYIERVEPAGA